MTVSEPSSRPRLAGLSWSIVGAALAVGWLGAVGWIVPSLIRAAYRGDTFELLNRAIAGQAEHPVEEYLSAWRSMATWATVGLVTLSALAFTAFRFRAALADASRRFSERWVQPPALSIRPHQLVWLAVGFGLCLGFGEAVSRLLRLALAGPEPGLYYRDLLWMLPMGSAAVFGTLGVVLAAAACFFRVLRSTPLVIGAFALFGTAELLDLSIRGLHWASVWLAAIGIATVAARAARTHPRSARRTAVLGTWGLLGLLTFVATAVRLGARRDVAGAVAALPNATAASPNVLLIILDTVRAQSLSLYGYGRPTSPELEELSTRGVTFDLVFAPSSWTLPSHATAFTGRQPGEHGAEMTAPLDARYPTLSEALRDRGYATTAFVANTAFGDEYWGLDRGFLEYDVRPLTVTRVMTAARLSGRIFRNAGQWALGRGSFAAKRHASSINEAFLAWLDRRPERPFFAFLNYMDAHTPYSPPPPFDRRFSPPEPLVSVQASGHVYSEEELERLRVGYDNGIAYLDHELGLLFDELDRRGLRDNTLIIVTGDHGEAFGEHDTRLVEHGASLYSPVLHVPLIVVLPGSTPPGSRVGAAVSLADLPATVLELTSRSTGDFPGTSMSRYWTPEGTQQLEEPVLSELGSSVWLSASWQPGSRGRMRSLLSQNLHFILNGDGSEELYDLTDDPWEQTDLSRRSDYGDALGRFRSALGAPEETGS